MELRFKDEQNNLIGTFIWDDSTKSADENLKELLKVIPEKSILKVRSGLDGSFNKDQMLNLALKRPWEKFIKELRDNNQTFGEISVEVQGKRKLSKN